VNLALSLALLLGIGSAVAQAQVESRLLNIPGTLELVDKPPAATPVEVLDVMVRQLSGGRQFHAQPDHDGNFKLQDLAPGRYSLNLSFPGRIQVFACGSRSLMPDDFELTPGEAGPLHIVVTLKTADVAVEITELPEYRKETIALLSPADPYLTLRESGLLNKVAGTHTRFRFVPPGKYTLLIVDAEFQSAIAFSAAVREALKDRAAAVQVPDGGEMVIRAGYIPADLVKQGMVAAGVGR
jgi:hypothetical protein